MKIANIVTNAVLGAAVVVLLYFILQVVTRMIKAVISSGSKEMAEIDDISIAYFQHGFGHGQWDLYYEYQQELEKKQTEKEAEFAGKTETFYQSVQDAQYKIQRGLVTRSEAEQLQQQLATDEQTLMALQNQYAAELQEEGMVKNRQMLDMIERYVAELSETNGFSYVYSYQFGGNLIYGAEPSTSPVRW